MAVTRIDWAKNEGYDVHVLRGATSLPLSSILALIDDVAQTAIIANPASLPPDVHSLRFEPQFAGATAGNIVSGHGVEVNTQTGAVTAVSSLPTPALRSFVVDAVVEVKTPTTLRELPRVQIRVYIHPGVRSIRLTPSTLTIPEDADGQRFSILAEFDDDTIGDITRLGTAPASSGNPPLPGFSWTSADSTVVSPDAEGKLTIHSVSASPIQITATVTQPGWPSKTAQGNVVTAPGWGSQPAKRRELRLVGKGPGVSRLAEVPNVLILPDGFLDTQADQNDFNTLVDRLVDRLNTSGSTTPFDLLSGAINYWSVFVPSRERGTTTLYDMCEFPLLSGATRLPLTTLAVNGQTASGASQINLDGPAFSGALPAGTHFTIAGDPTLYTTTNQVAAQNNALAGIRFAPALVQTAADNAVVTIIGQRIPVALGSPAAPGPPPQNNDILLDNLVYVVGMPVLAEHLPRRANAADLTAKVTDWEKMYGSTRINAQRVNLVVYDLWGQLLFHDHRLANEKDTAFGLAIGERPRAQVKHPEQTITWHPFRADRAQIDKFIETLTFRGATIDQTWTSQPGGAPGKDRGLVFILAGGARHSGTRTEGANLLVALGLVDDENLRVRYGTGRSLEIVSFPLNRDATSQPVVSNYVHATLAHEAAHAFDVTDEYGGMDTLPPGGIVERRLIQTGNVTPASEVSAATGITGDTLRWRRWPRIRKAGVLTAPPAPEPGAAGVFAIQLRAGHQKGVSGNVFKPGDAVFLRQRPLLKPSTSTPPQLNHALVSVPLQVIAPTRTLGNDELQVRVQSGTLNPAEFSGTGLEAPILFEPAPAPASAATAGDKHAEMMAQFIRAHIKSTHGPLNAPANNPSRTCVPPPPPFGFMDPQPATNLPPAASFPGGKFPQIPSLIVGAYEGGEVFSCGIFHPAGVCIMRAPLAPPAGRGIPGFQQGSVHAFCPVCRYLIVDRIDPSQHGAINNLYLIYPQP